MTSHFLSILLNEPVGLDHNVCVSKLSLKNVSKHFLFELRPRVPVNNISVMDVKTPPREREIEGKVWIDLNPRPHPNLPQMKQISCLQEPKYNREISLKAASFKQMTPLFEGLLLKVQSHCIIVSTISNFYHYNFTIIRVNFTSIAIKFYGVISLKFYC